jgi:RHS repeat-associated protein
MYTDPMTSTAGEINNFTYEYSIKDHLGNSRVMFSDLNGNGQVTESEIIQVEHYYPFGMSQEGHGNAIISETAYTYNGKELNSDFGLDLHDYGARWYDASIGRWHGVDPLAEAFIVHSPYNYGVNNPIMMVDPDGRSAMAAGGGRYDQNLHGGEITRDKDGNPTSVRFGNNSSSSNTSSNNYVHGVSGGEISDVRHEGWMYNGRSGISYLEVTRGISKETGRGRRRHEIAKAYNNTSSKFVEEVSGKSSSTIIHVYNKSYLMRLQNEIINANELVRSLNPRTFEVEKIPASQTFYGMYVLSALNDLIENGADADPKSLYILHHDFLVLGMRSILNPQLSEGEVRVDAKIDLFANRAWAFEQEREVGIEIWKGYPTTDWYPPLFVDQLSKNPLFYNYVGTENIKRIENRYGVTLEGGK